jgi:hypothetical protein
MDDRILAVPLTVAPDPAVFEKWPALKALLSRLREFLPVDFVIQPTLKGQKASGRGNVALVKALVAQVRPEHHVLAFSCSELLLVALLQRPVRSLIASGFFPSPRAMAAHEDESLAAGLAAIMPIISNPGQFVRIVMSGADEELINRTTREIEATVDKDLLQRIWYGTEPPISVPSGRTLDFPALYLTLPVLTPGRDEVFDYFRRHVPNTKLDQLHEWGFHLHEEKGGHELANKVIPFIQEVIAQREAAGQT